MPDTSMDEAALNFALVRRAVADLAAVTRQEGSGADYAEAVEQLLAEFRASMGAAKPSAGQGDQGPQLAALAALTTEKGVEPGKRRRPAAGPVRTIYIRAPEETANWFTAYTNARGHRAFWQSIEDLRALVEGRMQITRGGETTDAEAA